MREELINATRHEFVDVCDYRIIPERPSGYALTAVTTALHDFQDMVTYVYDVITSGRPKQRARLDPAIVEKTRFDFGFAYSGSLGIVLTIPNERLLGIESDLDMAVAAVFDFMGAERAEQIREAAQRFGVPTVRKFYSWSKAHRDYGMDAEIKWIRDADTRRVVLTQAAKFEEICGFIEGRSEEVSEDITLTGQLVGYNVHAGRFAFEAPDADVINGSFTKEFEAVQRQVPRQYTARVIKQTIQHYASDRDDVSWFLVSLSEQENDNSR